MSRRQPVYDENGQRVLNYDRNRQIRALQKQMAENVGDMAEKNAKLQKKINGLKLGKLLKRISAGRVWQPVVGDLIYVPTRMSLGHGSDDIHGGLATIKFIKHEACTNPVNTIFIDVNEVDRGFNWHILVETQKELRKEFGKEFAFPDPDDRPQFNDGHLDRNW